MTMSISPSIVLEQKAFPFVRKYVALDSTNNKIRINQSVLFKSDELQIDIHRLNPNVQRVKRLALPWLFIAIALSVYLIVCLSAWFWSAPTSTEELTFYIIGQFLLSLGTLAAWWRFFNNSYHLILFFDKYTNTVAFDLISASPTATDCEHFIESVIKHINNWEQTRTLQTLLFEIPTHILVGEFSNTYIDELLKRGVDVNALLCFLQKRTSNTLDTPSRLQ